MLRTAFFLSLILLHGCTLVPVGQHRFESFVVPFSVESIDGENKCIDLTGIYQNTPTVYERHNKKFVVLDIVDRNILFFRKKSPSKRIEVNGNLFNNALVLNMNENEIVFINHYNHLYITTMDVFSIEEDIVSCAADSVISILERQLIGTEGGYANYMTQIRIYLEAETRDLLVYKQFGKNAKFLFGFSGPGIEHKIYRFKRISAIK